MKPISSVAIPSTLSLSLPKPHTTYQIQVSLHASLQSYQLTRRFSQFVELDRQLQQATGQAAPVPLPPKTLWGQPDVAARRVGLERYLKTLVAHESLGSSAPLLHFLEVPLAAHAVSSVTDATSSAVDANTNTAARSDFAACLEEVHQAVQRATQALAKASSSTAVPADRAALQSACHLAERSLQRLTRLDDTYRKAEETTVSGAEELRRRDQVEAMQRRVVALTRQAAALRSGQRQDERSPFGGHASQSATATTATTGGGGGGGGGGGRRLGPAQETSRTLGQSNGELLQDQQLIFQEQDDALASLLPVLQRQRQLAGVIGEELADQNRTLDEVSGLTDGVAGKLKKGKVLMKKVTGK